ncbi:MAG: PQQ-dependent sugar dehydrogenase [Deinococcus sp.]
MLIPRPARQTLTLLLGLAALGSYATYAGGNESSTQGTARSTANNAANASFPTIVLPAGYRIEKVADKLTYPTSITWDDQGRMYVAEAGGAFLEEPPPARILRIENGKTTEVANLTRKGIKASVVGLFFYKGAFYFTHRAQDLTGAVSRMTMDGKVTQLFSGFIDSQTDHQLNDIRVGPDGRMYVTSGAGGNSGVMGEDMIPFVLKSPMTHTTSCKDIVLTGVNHLTPDFRTKKPNDSVMSGAFVPFGTPTHPGQVIKGINKCGGAILTFDPNNAEATLKPYAWGFRNVIGMAWGKNGEMYATQNGYDAFGSRPIKDQYDPTYRVRENAWYGVPDYSAALEPLTDPKFTPPGQLMPQMFRDGKMLPKKLTFLIDHQASGLMAPDKSLVLGLHEVNSSPSKPDVAPASWGEYAGQLFVPEWGDMAWVTNALKDKPSGNRISVIDPKTGKMNVFIRNINLGPASAQGALGKGIERPFDVKFGPDGAMYIVDYGVFKINLQRIAEGRLPFEWPPFTGAIWKVSRTGQ